MDGELNEVKAPPLVHRISKFLDVLDCSVWTDHCNPFVKCTALLLHFSASLCLYECAHLGIVCNQMYVEKVAPFVEVREVGTNIRESFLSLVVTL